MEEDTPSRKRRERDNEAVGQASVTGLQDESFDTSDELCRAVKRLHTRSSRSPSGSDSMEGEEQQDASLNEASGPWPTYNSSSGRSRGIRPNNAGDIEAANLGRGRINVSGSTISSAARRFQGAPEVGLPTGFRRSAIQQFRDLQTGELHSGHSNTDSEPNLSALQHLQIGAQEPTPSNLGPYEASFPRPVTVPSETHSRDNFPQFRSNDGQSTQNLKDNCFSRSAQPSSFRIRSSSLPPRYPLVDQPSEGLQGSRQQSGVSRLQHETNLARLNLAAERDTSNALSSDRQTSPSHHNRHLMRVQKHLDNLNVYGSRETSQEDSTEIQPPSTPHRDESAVQSQQKYRSGRKEEQPVKASSYVDMYEEANNLLNNLHFERVKRIHKD